MRRSSFLSRLLITAPAVGLACGLAGAGIFAQDPSGTVETASQQQPDTTTAQDDDDDDLVFPIPDEDRPPPVQPQPPEEPEPQDEQLPELPGDPGFERALDSAGNESVIGEERLEANVTPDLSGVFRYEPGVQVQSSTGRFGDTSINIRGLEGNRVLISVDGVRSPDAFLQGPIQLGRANVDPSLLKQVEIVRGPGSLIYGEGGIGGVVAFETKDPADFLDRFDQDLYIGLSGSYFSSDGSYAETPIVAARVEDLDVMVAYTRRDGSELDSAGAFGPDPQDYQSNYILGKLVYHFNEQNELDFTFETYNLEAQTNLRSTLAPTPGAFNTFITTPEVFPGALPGSRFLSDAADQNKRTRYSLTHDYRSEDDGIMSSARFQVYFQEAGINDARLQRFLVPAIVPPLVPNRHIVDDFNSNFFDQTHIGGRIIFRGDVEGQLTNQSLIYGIDALKTDTDRLRTGTVTNQATGVAINSNQISEETPSKVLPDVTTYRVGMFFRDKIEFDRLPFSLAPGVRLNYYESDFALPDPLFDPANGTPQDSTEWNAQPAIDLNLPITDQLEAVVRYARGYRGPPVEDAGVGFINPLFGYTVVPNTNLTSEKSDSVDFGMSYSGETFAAYGGGFYNHYDGFIETVSLGLDPNSGLLLFQSQNLAAQIYGVEASGELRLFGEFYELEDSSRRPSNSRDRDSEGPSRAFAGWSAFGNFTQSVGDNLDDDIPLDSIPPMYGIMGLRYRAMENRWGVEFISTMVHRKDRYSGVEPDQFITPGYGVFDILAYAKLTDRIEVNAGVFNVLDKEYYQWLNLRGVTTDQRDLTRFAAPGINFAATVRVHW